MRWDCISQNVPCHSQPVGHRKGCDENAIHRMCKVTHSLLVIRKDVMRLFHKMCKVTDLLLVIGWDCLSQNVQCHSLPVGDRKRCDETTFHKMYIIVQCHSHTVGDRKRCDETACRKTCNVTHKLLVNVMRLCFTRCVISLTCCWS